MPGRTKAKEDKTTRTRKGKQKEDTNSKVAESWVEEKKAYFNEIDSFSLEIEEEEKVKQEQEKTKANKENFQPNLHTAMLLEGIENAEFEQPNIVSGIEELESEMAYIQPKFTPPQPSMSGRSKRTLQVPQQKRGEVETPQTYRLHVTYPHLYEEYQEYVAALGQYFSPHPMKDYAKNTLEGVCENL